MFTADRKTLVAIRDGSKVEVLEKNDQGYWPVVRKTFASVREAKAFLNSPNL
jgi:hypothetical protein